MGRSYRNLLRTTVPCMESSYLHMLVFAEHLGRFGSEESPDGVPHINRRRGAGGGPLRQRAPRSVGPSQVGVRRRVLRS